ncbi:MAG: hypothetical protein MI742_15500 [Desulfobacterales bacterium]|nr:hypothetical protein [Desulfobacterales bacterium]
MKKIGYLSIVLIFFLVCISGSANAYENSWNKETTARELCFLFTLYQDWKQTRVIAANPNRFKETNPILGKHPTRSEVDTYFTACALGHAMIAYMLPPRASKIWQTMWIGIQSDVIEGNSEVGVRDVEVMEYHIQFSIPF